jgi:RHS repeat-associated protein
LLCCAEVYVYEASGMRLIRYPDSDDGKPVLSIRDASGQLAAEYVVDPALGGPKFWKDFVYGAGQLLVEREVVESVPKLAASSPLSTNSTVGMTLTAGDGSSSYAVDIRTDSGYTNLVTGIVPNAQGKFSIPESAVFPGETNFLRIRGEGPQPSRYSAAATVTLDPTVDSSSPNQVKYVSVSRSGTQVTVRWQLQQANGKKFKVYFTRADTGQAVLLTQFPLASTSTNITFLDQALASPCGVFTITQTLADGSQETLPSTGAGLPSPGGGDVFGGNQGGCDPDPPPPPGPSGPTWVNTFHHRDHLGSLRVTTDAAGWMLSGHDFYPFGMEVAESGQAAGGPSRMKFTGHERDDLTGLDYMKARYSGWFQASFLIPDPANDVNPRNPQSWNRYAYVRNNPMNLVDPSGMNAEDKASTVISKDPCGTNNGGGATCDDRGLKTRNDDASKKADEANRKEEGKDPVSSDAPEPRPKSWDPSQPLPDNPDDLGPDWRRDPTHKNPNGDRYVNDTTGDKLDWEPGRPDLPGWRGRDHWHWVPGGKKQDNHYRPGDTIKQFSSVGIVGALVLGIIITILAPQLRLTPGPTPAGVGPFGPKREDEWM